MSICISCLDSLDPSIVWTNPCNITDNKDTITNLQDDLKVAILKIISSTADRKSVGKRVTFLSDKILLCKGLFTEGLSIFEDTYCKLLDQYVHSLLYNENSDSFDRKKWGKIKNGVLNDVINNVYNYNVICNLC